MAEIDGNKKRLSLPGDIVMLKLPPMIIREFLQLPKHVYEKLCLTSVVNIYID